MQWPSDLVGWIDAGRYWLALALFLSLPAAILYWLLVHPFARIWRRIGPTWTMSLLLGVLGLPSAFLLWRVREDWLAERYPFSWWLGVIGLALYALAWVIEVKCRRHLTLRILVGVPELKEEEPNVLLSEGIYSHTRNPRYLDLIVGLSGIALIINYPTIYGLVLLTTLGLLLVIRLEERELADRIGEPYLEYCRKVPRLIPRSMAFLRD